MSIIKKLTRAIIFGNLQPKLWLNPAGLTTTLTGSNDCEILKTTASEIAGTESQPQDSAFTRSIACIASEV